MLFQKEVSGMMRHPAEVEALLAHLAVNWNLFTSTQNLALNALVFLDREVLQTPVEGLDALRARMKKNLPVVLTVEEAGAPVAAVMGAASGLPVDCDDVDDGRFRRVRSLGGLVLTVWQS